MGITKYNLDLLRYIQEKHKVSLNKVAQHFNKSETTIRREIEIINLYTKEPSIYIHNSICQTKLSYAEFTSFIQSISFDEYSSNSDERINVLLVQMFFHGCVNATALYQSWNLSLTTKKSDTARLREYLKTYNLELISIKKKGLALVGDDFKLRLILVYKLYRLIELSDQNKVIARKANTIIEQQIYQTSMEQLETYIPESFQQMNEFLENYRLTIAYPFKKFLLLFIAILKYRNLTTNKKYDLKCAPTQIYFTSDPYENYIFNIVLDMLDFSPNLNFPYDEKLAHLVDKFASKIEECITYKIYARQAFVEELYCYLYKVITANSFHCLFIDKTVRNTREELSIPYQIIQKFSRFFYEDYDFELKDEHLSTLAIMLQKHRIRNRIVNKNQRKIVIVTSISYERISYFITQLKDYVDIVLVDVLDSNDIYQLQQLEYDFILCFSERIYTILKRQKLPALLIHFFLDNDDIEKLLMFGFRRTRKRFFADRFVEELENKNKKEMIEYLKEQYEDYFI
ncbi:MAG: helix-turn-helix domain-containing protein [Erysipelotrichaceae bacterium]|nr:helix-turn-helix domain-containing protein [Erysipelotrichaceae bacterium]